MVCEINMNNMYDCGGSYALPIIFLTNYHRLAVECTFLPFDLLDTENIHLVNSQEMKGYNMHLKNLTL